MISFKTFITEAKSAPLYHATRYGNAGFILGENTLKPSRRAGQLGGNNIAQAISLTRSIKTARDWVPTDTRVIFELDQNKLAQNYKITPVNMANVWRDSGTRSDDRRPMLNSKHEELFEEMVNKPITDLSKYLTKVIVDMSDTWLLPENVRAHKLLYMNGKFVNQ